MHSIRTEKLRRRCARLLDDLARALGDYLGKLEADPGGWNKWRNASRYSTG